MTTTRGGDGDTNADEVQRRIRDDIADTRAQMEGTLGELHAKLNPEVLKEQAIEQFRELKQTITAELKEAKDSMKSDVKAELAEAKAAMREATIGKVEKMVHDVEDVARDTGDSIVSTIRANPLPVALTGVGLAWLLLSARGSRRERRYDDRIRVREKGYDRYDRPSYAMGAEGGGDSNERSSLREDISDRAGSFVDAAKNKADDIAGTVKEKAGDIAQTASDIRVRAGRKIGAIEDRAASLARQAKDRGMELEGNAERMYADNPFVFGAALAVAGAAVGMALPITSKESEWLGGASSQLMGRARGLAEEAIERVGEAAERATDQVASNVDQRTQF